MKLPLSIYKRNRFPPDMAQYAAWVYYGFNLSIRDVDVWLAQRSIIVSYEAVRKWSDKIGLQYQRESKRVHGGRGDACRPADSQPDLPTIGVPLRPIFRIRVGRSNRYKPLNFRKNGGPTRT